MSVQPKAMTEEEVCAAVDAELGTARILRDGRIGTERALAYRYYFGEAFGNEEDGRSKVVSQLVMEIVDSLMPDLIKIFCGGEKAVEFTARKEQDVPLAEQATEVCNYVFFTQNQGFLLLYSAIKDALLQKTGCWKYWWEKERKIVQESFEGLDEGQILLLKQDPDVEIVAASPSMGALPAPPSHDGTGAPPVSAGMGSAPPIRYDVTVKRTKEAGHICIAAVPPEELLVSTRARTVDTQDVPFIAHETRKTRSELVEMGHDKATVLELPAGDSDVAMTEAASARQTRTEGASMDGLGNASDPMQQLVTYVEAHQYLDADGDGISELRFICKVGHTILHNQPTERVNLAVITPKIMPHEFFGVSLADDSMDLQLLKSTLWRMGLDAGYLSLYPRVQVVEGMASVNTYADLMAPGPGKPIRVKAQGAIVPFEMPDVAQKMFPMMEFLEQEVEGRTPVNRQYQGLPDNVLNKTATQSTHESSRSQARTELIARIFAETGIKELFRGILWLLGKYQNEPMIVRISNKYVPIDPRAWKTEYDMTCNVGLGAGSKGEQLMLLNNIAQAQATAVQAGGMGLLVSPKNIYNLQAKVAQVAGFKDPQQFWTAPPDNWQPPGPQESPQEKVAKINLAADGQKTQALHEQKAQSDRYHADLEEKRQIREFDLKKGEQQMALQLQQSNDQRQNLLDQQKHAENMAQIQADAEFKWKLENMKAATSITIAEIGAGLDNGSQQRDASNKEADMNVVQQLTQLLSTPKKASKNPDGSWTLAREQQPKTMQ